MSLRRPTAWPTVWPTSWLDSFLAPLARANADRLFDGDDEDLPVADAPGLGALLDRFENVVHELVGHDDLDLHLGDEVDDVCRSPVDLFLASRAAEALHLGHGHSLDADLGQRVLHLVELERLEDGFYLLPS